jgi:iron(III) transport system ATP-binding protein
MPIEEHADRHISVTILPFPPLPKEMAEILIDGIVKRYGDSTIIDHLSLSIRHGEFFTLLGPSGCGKTTLLRMIAGFIIPDEGRLLLDGQDITRMPAHKRETGMVFQDYALFPDKTVFDNVAYGLRVRRQPGAVVSEKVGRMLERVELGHLAARYPAELSGGQRQRVALARALVIEPRVLLMDEPLSNLDAKLRIQMRDVIRQLQQEARITAIFVTHDQEEALSMSDRIALLRNGRIDQLDTPEGLYARPQTAYAADFIGAANLLDVSWAGDAGEQGAVEVAGARVEVANAVPGEPYRLAVRPEHVGVHAVTGEDGMRLVATVVHRRYLGHKVSYALRLPDGQTLNADVPAAAASRLDGEAQVILTFSADCRLVLA